MCQVFHFRVLGVMPSCYSKFSLITLCQKVANSKSAIEFLKVHGILNSKGRCKKCSKELTEVTQHLNTSYYYFFCPVCRTKVSIRDGSILSGANIGLRTFCLLAYTFVMCQGLTLDQKIHEVRITH